MYVYSLGFGLASHLGVLADIPTIGVGKTIFVVDGLDVHAIKQQSHEQLLKGGQSFALRGTSGRVWGEVYEVTKIDLYTI